MSTTLTSEQIESLGALEVYDEQGGKVKVASLFEGGEGRTTVCVFIRHFYCAFDKNYIAALSSSLSPSSNLIIIGCGSWEPIKFYREETLSPFPIYADPSRSTYQVLQMLPNLPLSKLLFTNQIPLPKYLQEDGTMKLVGKSGRAVWSHLGLVWKGGVYDQNGGEVVFERDDATGKVRASFVHLMRNPADHTEVDELMKVASLRGVEAT